MDEANKKLMIAANLSWLEHYQTVSTRIASQCGSGFDFAQHFSFNVSRRSQIIRASYWISAK